MGVFQMVTAMVSADILSHLNSMGCPDHKLFMQWLQHYIGVTGTEITENIFQFQGSWESIEKVNKMLTILLTAHKAENMEELCCWLKSTVETTESQIEDSVRLARKCVTAGTQTDYLSGLSVTEEMMHAIQEGYTNIIKNAAVPAISSPNFAPQINIFTGNFEMSSSLPDREHLSRARSGRPGCHVVPDSAVGIVMADNSKLVDRHNAEEKCLTSRMLRCPLVAVRGGFARSVASKRMRILFILPYTYAANSSNEQRGKIPCGCWICRASVFANKFADSA